MTKEWTQEERQKAAAVVMSRHVSPGCLQDQERFDFWVCEALRPMSRYSEEVDLQCELNEIHKMISAALSDYQRYGTITRAEQDDIVVWLERNK